MACKLNYDWIRSNDILERCKYNDYLGATIRQYGKPSDVFALGVTAWELKERGDTPNLEFTRSIKQVQKSDSYKDYSFSCDTPLELIDFILKNTKKMWCDRLTVDELLDQEFIKKLG